MTWCQSARPNTPHHTSHFLIVGTVFIHFELLRSCCISSGPTRVSICSPFHNTCLSFLRPTRNAVITFTSQTPISDCRTWWYPQHLVLNLESSKNGPLFLRPNRRTGPYDFPSNVRFLSAETNPEILDEIARMVSVPPIILYKSSPN